MLAFSVALIAASLPQTARADDYLWKKGEVIILTPLDEQVQQGGNGSGGPNDDKLSADAQAIREDDDERAWLNCHFDIQQRFYWDSYGPPTPTFFVDFTGAISGSVGPLLVGNSTQLGEASSNAGAGGLGDAVTNRKFAKVPERLSYNKSRITPHQFSPSGANDREILFPLQISVYVSADPVVGQNDPNKGKANSAQASAKLTVGIPYY